MKLKINGNEQETNENTIRGLIKSKGLDPKKIVIEHNFKIIPQEEWDSMELKDNDKLEIVSFVGGG